MSEQPKGMLAILSDETGRVVVAEADFAEDGYGGFTLAQAQQVRLKRAVAYAMLNAYASPALVRAVDGYDAEKIMATLCRQHGYRLTWKAIGHAPEDWRE